MLGLALAAPCPLCRTRAVIRSSSACSTIRTWLPRRHARPSFAVPSSSPAAPAGGGGDVSADEDSLVPSVVTHVFAANGMRRNILLEMLPDGRGQAIVVVGVLEGSDADRAGVVPGQKLISISDPIRPDQQWSLQDRPSLRFVKDVINANRNKDVSITFSSKALFFDVPESISGSRSGSDNEDAAPLSSPIPAPRAAASDVQKRIERRSAYMAEVEKRNDSSFVAWAVGLFLGPAAAILAWAYFSGYLDAMYTTSLSASGQ